MHIQEDKSIDCTAIQCLPLSKNKLENDKQTSIFYLGESVKRWDTQGLLNNRHFLNKGQGHLSAIQIIGVVFRFQTFSKLPKLFEHNLNSGHSPLYEI